MARNFASPPDNTKPRTYWYWINGRVSKEGITRDLEAMKTVGIGEAYIGVIGGNAGDTGPGEVPTLSEQWWQMLEHAVREGGRLGVDIGLFNGPAWSQSGGPWVKPEQSMRHLVTTELRVRGPQRFEGTLAAPRGALPNQDVITIAFPAPTSDADSIAIHSPQISGGPEAQRLFDGDMGTSAPIPGQGKNYEITLEVERPFTARSLVFFPSREIVSSGELQVSDDGVTFRKVADYTIDRHYLSPALGAEPLAPVSLVFPATTGRFFRLTFSNADPLKEIVLSSAARIENYAEKHLGKMFQGPQPPQDYYDWRRQPEPDNASLCVPPQQVRDISVHRRGDKLVWDVPEGNWVVQRFAMASTGSQNSPAPSGATGLEIDKLNRVPLRAHFDAYVGKLLKRMPATERKALKHVVIDSYEVGSQNWTEGMGQDFKARFGYDATPYLPTLSGRIVGSADQANRFLWDFRRLIADRVGTEYIGGLRDISREHGLKLWSENYGHGGFFGEFLQYGSQTEEISGEFWESGNPGQIELRDASSAAHIYGKPVVYAEAWTGGPAFTSTPWSLKKVGDWAFCQGINHMVFHVNIAQPDEVRPGISAWFGTEFNRHNTWFTRSQSWVEYLKRCHYMLQQGKYVADVAYFIGEDTPKMSGIQKPKLPDGYSSDYINADVILKRLTVKNGRFVLPDGMSYKLLAIPPDASMRPETLQKLHDLVQQGGAVLGEPPTSSPSLQNYPACDQKIKSLATAMWKGCDGVNVKSAVFGKGRVFRKAELQLALTQLGAPSDLDVTNGASPNEVLFTHRRAANTDIYFLSNQSDRLVSFVPSFRVRGKAPELWNPITGQRTPLVVFDSANGRTRVPLRLTPRASAFVVFRNAITANPIVQVSHNGQTISSTRSNSLRPAAETPNASTPSTFTMMAWLRPRMQTTIPNQTKTGFSDLYTPRNDFIFPTQGDTFNLGQGYAGSGMAVGTNGVAVYEHSGQYFVPLLVYATPIKGWTHVAVVYDKGQTKLYLNGQLVHNGLKTDYNVRPSEPSASFVGSQSGFSSLKRALTPVEIQQAMKKTSPIVSTEDALGGALLLEKGSGNALKGIAWKAGAFTLRRTKGAPTTIKVPQLIAPLAVKGSWQLAFPTGSGAPAQMQLDKLASLTEQSEPTVKYFSGTVTYSKNIDVPASALGAGRRLYLDLGEVESLVEVTVNEHNLGTLWSAPFVLDISKVVQPGANSLKLWVTNVWHNRLAGQRNAPEAFSAPGVEKVWTSSMPQYQKNEELFPTGLIGPVWLRQAAEIQTR